MKTLKTSLITLLIVPLIAASVMIAKAEPAKAMTNDNLGNLIVLNGLFNGGGNTGNLAGLVALNNITGNGNLSTGNTNLGDLIVLNGLFGSSGFGFNNNLNGLAGLIAIDNLFGNSHL